MERFTLYYLLNFIETAPMSDVLPDEGRLAAEIDRLKAEFPKTRELYREVCALLFFRFGITPTANRLYQLVKRGSMSTPTNTRTSRPICRRPPASWLPHCGRGRPRRHRGHSTRYGPRSKRRRSPRRTPSRRCNAN
jgi:hypothetical protein